jgi:hypothetical protein
MLSKSFRSQILIYTFLCLSVVTTAQAEVSVESAKNNLKPKPPYSGVEFLLDSTQALGYVGIAGGLAIFTIGLANLDSRGFIPPEMIMGTGLGISGLSYLLARFASYKKEERLRDYRRMQSKRKIKHYKTHYTKYDQPRVQAQHNKKANRSSRPMGRLFLAATAIVTFISIPEFTDGNCCIEDVYFGGLILAPALLSYYFFNKGNPTQESAWLAPTVSSNHYALSFGFNF